MGMGFSWTGAFEVWLVLTTLVLAVWVVLPREVLQRIGYYYDDQKPDEQQLDNYMTLALHVVQGLKGLSDGETVY